MIELYSENMEPSQLTIDKILAFSKSIKSINSTILNENFIININ